MQPNPYAVPTWAKVVGVLVLAGGTVALVTLPGVVQARRRQRYTDSCRMRWLDTATGELEPVLADSAATWMEDSLDQNPDISAVALASGATDYLQREHGLCSPSGHGSNLVDEVDARLRELAQELGANP